MNLTRDLQRYRADHHLTVHELAAHLHLPEAVVWELLGCADRLPGQDAVTDDRSLPGPGSQVQGLGDVAG